MDKLERNLALASDMSDEVQKKMSGVGKTMVRLSQQFNDLQDEVKEAYKAALKGGRKATALCNRKLSGELDEKIPEKDGGSEDGLQAGHDLTKHRSRKSRRVSVVHTPGNPQDYRV